MTALKVALQRERTQRQRLADSADTVALALEAGRETKAFLDAQIRALEAEVTELRAEREFAGEQRARLEAKVKSVGGGAASAWVGSGDGGDSEVKAWVNYGEVDVVTEEEQAAHVHGMRSRAVREGWDVAWSDVELGEIVGEGASGVIYRATLYGGTKCVAKAMKAGHSVTAVPLLGTTREGQALPALREEEIGSFLREIDLLASARHPRIVRFLGATLDWEVRRVVTYAELHEHGNLLGVFKTSRNIPVRDALRIAGDIASALAYLHARGIVHRDVKPSNVLLGRGRAAYLSDLGFARRWRRGIDEDFMTGETGTYVYMAPEVISHDSYGDACDVYSFGILLNELLDGKSPYSERYMTPLQVAKAVADRWVHAETGEPMPLRPATFSVGGDHPGAARLRGLVLSCWDDDPNRRPSFRDVLAQLALFGPTFLEECEPKKKKPLAGFWANIFPGGGDAAAGGGGPSSSSVSVAPTPLHPS